MKHSSRVIFHFILKNIKRKEVIIALAAIPAIILWSMVMYKYVTTPHAPQIREAGENSSYLYIAGSNIFGAKIGDSNTNAPKVEFTLPKTDKSVTFYPANTNKSLTKPVQENQEVRFVDVYEGVDFSYKTLPLGVKEDILIKKPGSVSTFPFYLDTKNVTPKYFTDKLAGGVFYDENKNYIFHFEKPYAIDAAGKRTEKVDISIRRDSETQKLMAILKVDGAWLNDPARAYPISVDPTVIHDTTSEFATGTLNRVKDTGSGSSPVLETYYQEVPTDQYTVGLWHMNNAWTDSSGNGFTGTAQGNAAFSTSARLGSHTGTFDGTGDYVTIGNQTKIGNLTSNLTVEAWIYPNSVTGFHRVVAAARPTSANGFAFGTSGDEIIFTTYGIKDYTTTTQSLTTGKWYHIAAVMQPNFNVDFYLDGKYVETITHTAAGAANTDDNFYIGAGTLSLSSTIAEEFNGLIDEVKISNIARSPEEIALDASRRPYSTYTSDVIDLSQTVASWNSLSWTELGVATGDGETSKDSSNLIAKWNFNESSGTTAAATDGSCGSSCNTTLTNFESTSSQDSTPLSGWTTNDRRWGAGALMLDGSNDYASCTDSSCGGTGKLDFDASTSFSYSAWFKTSKTGALQTVMAKQTTVNVSQGWSMWIFSDNKVYCNIYDATHTGWAYSGDVTVTDGKWHHVTCNVNRSTNEINEYVDGVNVGLAYISGYGTLESSAYFTVGGETDQAPGSFFNGTIDSIAVYSRVQTAAEIMSNYNSSNVELQTRVGSDSSPDDGNWEAWSPTTNETSVDSLDGPYQYGTTDSGLTDYWPMDETNGATVNNRTGWQNGTATGTQIVDGKFGKARSFTANSDKVTISGVWLGGGPYTIESWFRYPLPSTAAWNTLTRGTADHQVIVTRPTMQLGVYDNTGGTGFNGSGFYMNTLTNGWHHLAAVGDGGITSFYIDGKYVGYVNKKFVDTLDTIGNYGGGSQQFGDIDEVRIYNTAVSANTISQHYSEGSTNANFLLPKTDFTLKMEGAGSEKIQTGQLPVDQSTVGLWHFEETGGSSAYVKDSSPNANNGTPTAATVINSINGKGISFNGTSSVVTVGTNATLDFSTAFTLEAWVNRASTQNSVDSAIVAKIGTSPYNGYMLWYRTDNTIDLYVNGAARADSTYVIPVNTWTHVVATWDGTTPKIYINGVLSAQGATYSTAPTSSGQTFWIGRYSDNPRFFTGSIDEVRASNVARSAYEVAEAYRLGRDHYMNKTISLTDLSGKNAIPFYVAADRPGTYLTATAGESAFANYQPDANTIGLWHLDDPKSGNNDILKFASTNSTEANSYSYYKAIAGQSTVVATGDTIEYDFYLTSVIQHTGTIDARFTDTTYLRGYVSCHVGSFTAGTWHHRVCTIPSGANGKTIDWVDLVNENDTNTASTAYYDNFVVRNSAGAIKAILYSNGTTTYNTLDFESNAANTQTLTTSTYQTEGIVDVDQSIDNFMKDSSGYVNNGVPNSTILYQGKIGKARNFNGTSNYVSIPDSTSLRPTQLTISAWVKLDVNQGCNTSMINKYGGNYIGYQFGLYDGGCNSNPMPYFFVGSSSDSNVSLFAGQNLSTGKWQFVAATWDGAIAKVYIDGVLNNSTSSTAVLGHDSTPLVFGRHAWDAAGYFDGSIDEVRIDNTARSASDIRTAYEVGKRTHEVTIDFGAKLSADDLITGSGDYGFEVDATYYGLSQQADQLFKGDKIIVRENYDGTEYVAQGTVTAVTASSGAVTVASWDAGSTFPSGGYTVNASVFKWQREYWNITEPIDSQLNAVTTLSLRLTDGAEGRTIWIDDLKSADDYLTTSTGSTITSSTGYRYLQYRVIEHTSDNAVSANLTAVTLNYVDSSPAAPTELLAEAAVNPVGVTDSTPEFSALCNVPSTGNVLNKYRIQVDTNGTFASPLWDSGGSGTSMTDCVRGARSVDISYGGTALAPNGTEYYWRIKFWDSAGAEGAWSVERATFRMEDAPNSVLNFVDPSNCRIQEGTTDTSLTLLWNDNSTGETQFRIEKNTDSGGFGLLTNAAANATSNLDSSISQGHTYQYRVRAEGTVNTGWCTTNTVSIQAGTFQFGGLELKGLEIK